MLAGSSHAKRTQFRPGCGRLTEEIKQNEAKLGGNGVCGQRRLPCGAWLGRGVKRAKRTQFRGACGRVAEGIVQNKTPTTKVPKSGCDQLFWAAIEDRFA
jgi:hypothetical protein